jgi:hypothetical protein
MSGCESKASGAARSLAQAPTSGTDKLSSLDIKKIKVRTPETYLSADGLRDYILSYGVLDIPEGVDEPYFSPPLALSGFIIVTVNTQKRIVAKIDDRDHFTAEAVAAGQVTRPVHGRQIGRTRALHVTL